MKNLFETREAEAARQLFYFMGDHNGVTDTTVEQAWLNTDLSLNPAALRAAVEGANAAKAALSDPEQKRWGQYSI